MSGTTPDSMATTSFCGCSSLLKSWTLTSKSALRTGHLHGFGQVVVRFWQELLAAPEEHGLPLAAGHLRRRGRRGTPGRRGAASRRCGGCGGAARAGGWLCGIRCATATTTGGKDRGRCARRHTTEKTTTTQRKGTPLCHTPSSFASTNSPTSNDTETNCPSRQSPLHPRRYNARVDRVFWSIRDSACVMCFVICRKRSMAEFQCQAKEFVQLPTFGDVSTPSD